MLPDVGSGVWIEFEGGDVSFPIWTGCYWNSGDVPSAAAATLKTIIVTAGTLAFDNSAGSVTLQDSARRSLALDSSGVTATAGAAGRDRRRRRLAQQRRPGGVLMPALLTAAGSGLRLVFRYGREGQPAERAAQSMLAQSAHKLGLRTAHPVRLLLHPEVSVAMTAGARKPVVLLPASSREWSAERMQVVLLHELAHVQRGDWQTLIASEIALAVWWFHPLAWWLSRSVRRDAEQAADDRVLAAGTRPSDYAAHLLAIVRGLGEGEQAPRPAMAMAQLAGIEERVRAILDGQRRRGAGVLQGRVLACALGVAMLVLAVARPTAAHARDESDAQLAPLLPPPVPDIAFSFTTPRAPAAPRPPRAPHATLAPIAPTAPLAPVAPKAPLAPLAPHTSATLPVPPRAPLPPLPKSGLDSLDLSALDALSHANLPGRAQLKSLRIALAERDAQIDDAKAARAEQQAERLQQEAERVQQRAEQEAAQAQERAEQDAERGQQEAERAQQAAERIQQQAERVQADAERRAQELQGLALADESRARGLDIHLDGTLNGEKISKHLRVAMDKLGKKLAGLDQQLGGAGRRGDDGDDEDDSYERGLRLHQRGRYKEAIEAFQKAIDHDQRADDASYNIACGYAQLGDVDKTAEWLKRASDEGFDVEGAVGSDDDFEPVRQEPKFRAVLQELRAERGSRHAAEARALERRYQRLTQRNPKGADSWYSLGKELLEAGSYDFAAKAFQAAAERSQKPGNSLYNEACALALKGDKAAALDQLQKAIEQGFDDVHQLRRDEDLDAVHDEARFKDLVQLARDLELDIDRGSFELNIGSVHLWSRKNNKKHQADESRALPGDGQEARRPRPRALQPGLRAAQRRRPRGRGGLVQEGARARLPQGDHALQHRLRAGAARAQGPGLRFAQGRGRRRLRRRRRDRRRRRFSNRSTETRATGSSSATRAIGMTTTTTK